MRRYESETSSELTYHENPETRKSIGSLQDTTKNDAHKRQKRNDACRCVSIGHRRNSHLCEGARVDEQLDDKQKNQALANGALDANNRVVETGKDEHTSHDLVRNLNSDIGNDECLPGVCFAWTLPNLV